MDFKTIIGLEIHVELMTETKMFCSCKNEFGAEANKNVCPVCLGLPGALPIINKRALEYAVKAGIAMNCKINSYSSMDRKSYFYPDLVKGYQISQDDIPLCEGGYLSIETEQGQKKVSLVRIHIEEDTGKSLHTDKDETLLDFNRSGVPLIEIVSNPDMNSGKEARSFLEKLKATLKYIGVSDCKIEEGSLRCDVNINVENTVTHEKTSISEIKNIGSFRGVERAIEYEERRHIDILKENKKINKETRKWDELNQKTVLMREKISTNNYRFAPDGDLPPLNISNEFIEEIRRNMPESVDEKIERFMRDYNMSRKDAVIFSQDIDLADYYENLTDRVKDSSLSLNWLLGEVLRRLNEEGKTVSDIPFRVEDLAHLILIIKDGKINNNAGKKVLKEMFISSKKADEIISELGLLQVSDEGFIREVVDKVLSSNPQSIEDYKNGKDRAFGFLVGQCMKEMKGKGNPKLINDLLKDRLK